MNKPNEYFIRYTNLDEEQSTIVSAYTADDALKQVKEKGYQVVSMIQVNPN